MKQKQIGLEMDPKVLKKLAKRPPPPHSRKISAKRYLKGSLSEIRNFTGKFAYNVEVNYILRPIQTILRILKYHFVKLWREFDFDCSS